MEDLPFVTDMFAPISFWLRIIRTLPRDFVVATSMSCTYFVMLSRSSKVSFDFILVSMFVGVGLEIFQWEVQLVLHWHGLKLEKSEFMNGCGGSFSGSEISG